MKQNSCFSAWTVFLCVFAFSFTAAVRGEPVFTVTFNAPGALYQTPVFGTDTAGTDGIDSLDFGFQLPPFNQLTVRFSNNNYDGTLVKDVRAAGDAKTWVLEVSNLSAPFVLSWGITDAGSFLNDKTLTIAPRANPANATNMKSSPSLAVSSNGVYDIVLRKDNSQPVAMADTATLFLGVETTKLIDVIANDTDPDAGQTLSLAGVQGTADHGGTAAISSGKILYTPAANFKGEDTFTYTIQDSFVPPATASTTVTVLVADQIYAKRTHSSTAAPGTNLTVSVQVYYAANVTQFRVREYLPTRNDGSSWAYVANSAAVTVGCTVTPQQTGNQLSLVVTPSGGALPVAPGPVTVTYQITVPADTEVGITKTLTGDLFVNGDNTAVGTVPQTSFTINLYHTADYKNTSNQPASDWKIDFDELFQVIVLYNAGAYHLDAGENSGYGPGGGNQSGTPHVADYKNVSGQPTPDWKIDFDELFQVIVLYNAGVYHVDATENSGYGPGPAP